MCSSRVMIDKYSQIMCGLGNARVNGILEYERPEHVKKPTPSTPRSVLYNTHSILVHVHVYMCTYSAVMQMQVELHTFTVIVLHVCYACTTACVLYVLTGMIERPTSELSTS